MTLRKAQLQDHFYFAGLTSVMMEPIREDDADRAYLVKGLKATKNEYNVARALDIMGLEYTFQMTFGARGQFGTVILDFMVQTVPLPTPVWVHGEHWHMGERRARDLRAMAEVDNALGGSAGDPVEIWGDESETESLALSAVRRYLG